MPVVEKLVGTPSRVAAGIGLISAHIRAQWLQPVPAFYLRPQITVEIASQIAARAVDLLWLAPPQAMVWEPG
jgi:3-polyprenyl-4-hydroxybenzoate decarboxylase